MSDESRTSAWDGGEGVPGARPGSGYGGYLGAAPVTPPPPPPVPPTMPPTMPPLQPPPPGDQISWGPVDVTPVDVTPGAAQAPRPRRSATRIAATMAVVVALVLAGAVVRHVVKLSSDTTQPARFAPASTFAYVQVHLSPSAEQRLALFDFSRKFPGSPTNQPGTNADQVVDTLLKGVLKDTPVVYDVDIKPWLGSYAAVAAFADRSGKPDVLGIVAVKDKSSATTSLDRVAKATHIAYAFDGGYVEIARNQAALTDAQTQIKAGTLSSDATFTGDLASLPGNQLVAGWADLHKTVNALAALPQCTQGSADYSTGSSLLSPALPGFGAMTCLAPGQLQAMQRQASSGRLALGLTVTADYAGLQMRVRGATHQVSQQAVGGMVSSLPADTQVAVGVGSLGDLLTKATRSLDAIPGLGALLGDVNASQQVDGAVRDATGLSLAEIASVVGDRTVVAASHVTDGSDLPLVGMRSHPSDATQAKALAQRFADRVGQSTGTQVTVQQAGDDLVVADNASYAAKLAAKGDLGDASLFRTAMGNDVSGAVDAVYVDVHGIDAKAPIQAVGATVQKDGGDLVVEVRVVG